MAVEPLHRFSRSRSTSALAAIDAPPALARRIGQALEEGGVDIAEAATGAPCDVAVVTEEFRLLERPVRLQHACAEHPERPVVAIATERPGPHTVRKALHAGAAGLVELDRLEDTLAPTVRAVLAGQTCVPRERDEEIEAPALSARERDVLAGVGRGLTNGEIAAELYLAPSTVKSHLASAFRKLGVRSRAEAAAIVLSPAIRSELGLPDELGLS